MKKISFQIMNVLIKGTPSAIKNALNKLKPDSYVLTKFSYNPKKVDIEDTNIVKAGLTFEDWFEGEYVTPKKIPFVSMPDVRFIGLGAGGDGCRSDGSYVFYKDLGATSITQCYKFDEASPFMEEAGEVYGTLIVNVLKSFMDHTWKFRYKSWSTGEKCFWAFNSERDKELIAEWKKDDKEIAKCNAGNKKNKFYVDFDFEENNDSYKITGYKGKKKEIDISSYNPDKKIYAIGEYAFSPKQKGIINEKNRSKIVSVKLVEGLEKIEIGSFSGCKFLEEIDIPKGVKEIEKNAFLGCESLQTMKIPYSVKEIGESAFEGCKSLKKVIIPDGVKVISDRLFANCKSLKKVIIPDGVKVISDGLFAHCESLEEVEIPDGVTKIGEYAFCGCTSLKTIIIPETVKEIGIGAFNGCKSLTEIKIPEGVTQIYDDTFLGCESLEEVKIPDGVIEIGGGKYYGGSAFGGCTSLETLIIPHSVKRIHDETFYECESLKEIQISSSTKIEGNPFKRCDSLFDKDGFIIINNILYGIKEEKKKIIIPDYVKEIGYEAFGNCRSLKEVIIPDSVRHICSYAFDRCESLESIIIPDSIRHICSYAFYGCRSLKKIQISSSTKIEGNPFKDCDSLFDKDGFIIINNILFGIKEEKKKIIIPDYVKEIGYEAFRHCHSIEEIIIPNSVQCIRDGAFHGCESLNTVKLPNSLKIIGEGAFGYCNSLKTVNLPSTLKKIGEYAFYGCDQLEKINIPKGATEIAESAFAGTPLNPDYN